MEEKSRQKKTDNVDVDQLWRSLGQWGKFQVRQLIVLLIAIWSCGFHMLSIVFIGYRPEYSCKEVFENASQFTNSTSDISIHREYGECTVTTIYNDSGVVRTSETGCTNGWSYHDDGAAFNVERSFVSEWNLVCGSQELAEVSQTLVMLGQAFGAFIATSLSDRFGRKTVHVACHVIFFGIVLATAFVPNFAWFAVMRVLTGAFQQGIGLTIAILNLELFPMEIRGYMEVLGLVWWTTGIGLVTPIAYIFRSMSWRYLQICLACLSAWSLLEWWLIDESLRWLIANGKVDRAKEMIKRACKTNKKDYNEVISGCGFMEYELQTLKREQSSKGTNGSISNSDEDKQVLNGDKIMDTNGISCLEQESTDNTTGTKSYTVLDLVKSKRLMITSLIMWFTWITNSATYYGIMLMSSSLAGDRFLNFFLGSVVEYPAAVLESLMINRYGRKPTTIIFHCICGIALITATVLTTTANGSSGMIIGATAFTLIGKFAITGSFSTIFLYTPELYPTNMRNLGIGMSSAAARIGAMLSPFSRNLAEEAVWAPGLIFGVMCAIVVLLMFWVPETNNYELPQTLEECEVWYKDNQFKLPCQRKKDKTTIVSKRTVQST